MTFHSAIGISVIASFIVLFMLFTFKILWDWFLENWYLRLTCRHLTDIRGCWTTKNKDEFGNVMTEEMKIDQWGFKIEAEISYKIQFKDGRASRNKIFKGYGILRNDIVSMYYYNKNRREKGCGAFTLAVSKDGDIMRGHYCWWDTEAEKIVVSKGQYKWKRAIESV